MTRALTPGRFQLLAVALALALAGLALNAAASATARDQLVRAALSVTLYLMAWVIIAIAGFTLWDAALAGDPEPRIGWTHPVGPAAVALTTVLLAAAGASYVNGAILDPLQFRGFPDYVTQMRGARRLLDGLLPYDPTIRVWTDVNLPPITLLLIFAPFTSLSDASGRLAYFALNHAAFLLGAFLLLRTQRPPSGAVSLSLWAALVIALAAAFEPWHDSLRLGQQNGLVFLCIAAAIVAASRGWEVAAGAALAAAIIGKPSSALVGVYFLLAGRWRAAIAAGAVGLGAFLVTLPWTGIESWRFYLMEKAPDILAGTPQQSNVALLAFHARLFLPPESLASFDAMPDVPLASALTRVSQALGVYALWRLVRRRGRVSDPTSLYLEFCVALVLSLTLVGHAWQSYLTWLVVAFVPLADPRLWAALTPRLQLPLAVLAGACYAAFAMNDVTLHRVVGSTSTIAAAFAALPTFGLLAFAYLLSLLAVAHDRAAAQQHLSMARELPDTAPDLAPAKAAGVAEFTAQSSPP